MIETQKPKKYFVIPQKILFYQRNDEKLQQEQNKLIYRNTAITIVIGLLAILAQVGEILVSYFKG